MVQKQRQIIMPMSSNDNENTEKTSAIYISDTVAAAKQALLSKERERRDPSASLVYRLNRAWVWRS
jgi:hypothetical protein